MLPESADHEEKKGFLEPPQHSGTGPIIAILIILTLLILGVLYFFIDHMRAVEEQNNIPYIPSATTTIIEQQ